jgi:hypothetical protein
MVTAPSLTPGALTGEPNCLAVRGDRAADHPATGAIAGMAAVPRAGADGVRDTVPGSLPGVVGGDNCTDSHAGGAGARVRNCNIFSLEGRKNIISGGIIQGRLK